MDLTGMHVSVIAYNEPRHLYVTLDALSRVHGIDEFPITVYVDGGITEEIKAEQEEVLACFPRISSEFSEVNLGILENVMRGLRNPITKGAASVLYIEYDHLVRPEILSIPRNDNTGCFFISLTQPILHINKIYKLPIYVAKGNVITARNANKLMQWVKTKSYIGRVKGNNRENPIDENYTGHDRILDIYLPDHGEFTIFPVGRYVAHFGLFGTNFPRVAAIPELLELEQRMFAGPKERWLDNVAQILETGDYPCEPIEIDARLWPRGFRYYGRMEG